MMEVVSEKVSVDRTPGRMSVVISGRTTRAREALLVTWTLAWIACGVIVLIARSKMSPVDPARQYVLAFLAFWAYFLFAVGKALLWRLKGFELWLVKGGTVTVKTSIIGFGKAKNYFVENIQKLGLIAIDAKNWKWQWEQSAWVIGGERIGFEHAGMKVTIGKNLNDQEAARLAVLLKDALKEQRKQTAS